MQIDFNFRYIQIQIGKYVDNNQCMKLVLFSTDDFYFQLTLVQTMIGALIIQFDEYKIKWKKVDEKTKSMYNCFWLRIQNFLRNLQNVY